MMRAMGTLEPIIYFVGRDGSIALPPTTEDAKWIYEKHLKQRGYEWKEAGTLREVEELQKRLVEIEQRKAQNDLARDERNSEASRKAIGDRLYQRMVSSSTSAYERDFIRLYLQLRDDKREKYRQRWLEQQSYLWALEYDSSTKPTDRIK